MQNDEDLRESWESQDSTQGAESRVDSDDFGDSDYADSTESMESSAQSAESDADSNDSSDSSGDSGNSKDLRIKELEEKYIRTYAEFENIKKRLEREKSQALEYANEKILEDFLPILDTLESALNATENDASEAVCKVREGIRLTIDNFLKAFAKHSVEVINTDCEFDPNVHNAIMQVKSEGKNDGEIAQVIQKGYKYKNRVIRPSMVAITKN